jgi:hypothetical protein
MTLDLARTVADAVLYEGYLLYPYRATSAKNQARWQFGVLGPPGAAEAGLGEQSTMSVECLLSRAADGDYLPQPTVRVYLRFLQLQHRGLERPDAADPNRYVPTSELLLDDERLLSWDEAVDHERSCPAWTFDELADGVRQTVTVPGAEQAEPLTASDGRTVGRVVRHRWPLSAVLTAETTEVDGYLRLSVTVENTAPAASHTKDDAVRRSLLGAHLLLEASGTGFVSLLEPPDAAAASAAAACRRDPYSAGDDDDRGREGRGAGDRSAGAGDHRSLRGDDSGNAGTAARCPAGATLSEWCDHRPGLARYRRRGLVGSRR